MTYEQKEQIKNVKALCVGVYLTKELKKHGVSNPEQIGVTSKESYDDFVSSVIDKSTEFVINDDMPGIVAWEKAIKALVTK